MLPCFHTEWQQNLATANSLIWSALCKTVIWGVCVGGGGEKINCKCLQWNLVCVFNMIIQPGTRQKRNNKLITMEPLLITDCCLFSVWAIQTSASPKHLLCTYLRPNYGYEPRPRIPPLVTDCSTFLIAPSLVSLTPEDAAEAMSVAQDTIIGGQSQTKATAFTFS